VSVHLPLDVDYGRWFPSAGRSKGVSIEILGIEPRSAKLGWYYRRMLLMFSDVAVVFAAFWEAVEERR
jgi:hypothetical protein